MDDSFRRWDIPPLSSCWMCDSEEGIWRRDLKKVCEGSCIWCGQEKWSHQCPKLSKTKNRFEIWASKLWELLAQRLLRVQRYLHSYPKGLSLEFEFEINLESSQSSRLAVDRTCTRQKCAYLAEGHELHLHSSELGSMETANMLGTHTCGFHYDWSHSLRPQMSRTGWAGCKCLKKKNILPLVWPILLKLKQKPNSYQICYEKERQNWNYLAKLTGGYLWMRYFSCFQTFSVVSNSPDSLQQGQGTRSVRMILREFGIDSQQRENRKSYL